MDISFWIKTFKRDESKEVRTRQEQDKSVNWWQMMLFICYYIHLTALMVFP